MVDLLALARTVHGHCGLLAAIALLHPAIALRSGVSPRAGTRWSVGLATGLVTLTVAGGWWLYPDYRGNEKRRLLREASELAMLFETKEHLAFYALVLAWAGAALVFGAHRIRARSGVVGSGVHRTVRLARTSYALAAGLTLLVGVLGTVIASAAR